MGSEARSLIASGGLAVAAPEIRDLEHASKTMPTRVAIRDDFGQAIEYAELRHLVERLAAELERRRVGPGDIVSLLLPNSAAFAVAFLGARRLGAVVNPIATVYGPADVARVLARVQPAAVIASQAPSRPYADEAARGAPGAAVLILDPAQPDRVSTEQVRLQTGRRMSPDAALLVFTSGSEGIPKGVLHSSAAVAHASRESCRMLELGPDDVFFTAAPLGHLTGLFSGFRSPLLSCATAVLMDGWKVDRALERIEQTGATFMHGPPTMLIDLVRVGEAGRPLPRSLKKYRVAGAPVAPDVITRAAHRLGLDVFRGYGSTETLIITSSLATDGLSMRTDTDGAVLPGVEVSFRAAERGREILVRGATRCIGYLSDDGAVDAGGDDGWFATGDLGELVERRYLRISGRVKDIVVRGGLNISTAEVERALAAHINVAEVAVVGVPDPRLGERCCAVVVSDGGLLDVEDVRNFLVAQGMALFKAPEFVLVVKRLPRTANGKIARAQVAELARKELGLEQPADP